jgi:hypothetical protein
VVSRRGSWCSQITLTFGNVSILALLADINAADEIVPSSNNVVVLSTARDLLAWQQHSGQPCSRRTR